MKQQTFAMKTLPGMLMLMPLVALAFDSGSTGADGALNPPVTTEITLPPSGILNYTTVNIPAGVTVTFKKNAANTPVVILASGNVTVAGTINVSGKASPASGTFGDGVQGDDGLPGESGPGGFSGGRGGKVPRLAGGSGLGPGGGVVALNVYSGYAMGGFGGSFGANSTHQYCTGTCLTSVGAVLNQSYGSSLLLPLIGGSGGGGGLGGDTYEGSGGGGGGGALLLASSGTINVTGSILANGGASGGTSSGGTNIAGGSGGGGSGGGIRLVATTITGNGTISAIGGVAGNSYGNYFDRGGNGADGRIRIEGEAITRTAATTPAYTSDTPGPLFVAGLPTLVIDSVAGSQAPAVPTGNADITLPANTVNPVTVVLKASNVPVGNIVKVTVTPAYGAPNTVISPALSGTNASSTASVSVTLPTGPSTLQAQTTYTIVAALGDLLKNFAGNERVEQIELIAGLGGKVETRLITVSGKRFVATPEALAMLERNWQLQGA